PQSISISLALTALLVAPNHTSGQRPNDPATQRPGTSAGAAAGRFDTTRLIRVWDIRGTRPDEDPYARKREPGERMLLSTSIPPGGEIPLLASTGFTLFQTDSDHLSTEEVAPGVWEMSRPDADQRIVHDAGYDWSYFPHFAFPPKWYRDRISFTRIECLEHE